MYIGASGDITCTEHSTSMWQLGSLSTIDRHVDGRDELKIFVVSAFHVNWIPVFWGKSLISWPPMMSCILQGSSDNTRT